MVKQNGSVITVENQEWYAGYQQWFLLRSDAHHDSLYCNRVLEKKHLDMAKARNALIIDNGDLFDAMQGRHDPRSRMEELRPEFRVSDYYPAIIDDAFQFYAPYASNFLLLGKGNHEHSVLSHSNLDLTSALAYRLCTEAGSDVKVGGARGWIVLQYSRKDRKGTNQSIKIRFSHGGGTEAPVTKGVIDTARQGVYLPDADVVLNGHNHEGYVLAQKRERISQRGDLYTDICWFARTPGYKGIASRDESGWESVKNMSPKPMGCIWMLVEYDKDKPKIILTPDIE